MTWRGWVRRQWWTVLVLVVLLALGVATGMAALAGARRTASAYERVLEAVTDEIRRFRQLHSMTPGHPEFHETPGVEATTGPLGQGIANAVGFAISGKRAAAKFNTADHVIFDQHIFALHGDGCLQEGVAKEAIAFAGHFKLDVYPSHSVLQGSITILLVGIYLLVVGVFAMRALVRASRERRRSSSSRVALRRPHR